MEKVAALLAKENAQLWINHDKAQSATIPKAPRRSVAARSAPA